jgi:tRNA (guanine37-N1)-methyltransferase
MTLKKITIATIHPDFIKSYMEFGPFAAALKKSLIELQLINLRDFAIDKHGTVDGKPFGGDDGMILRPEPLAAAIESVGDKPYVIYTSPQGQVWEQKKAQELKSNHEHLFFICGRFSGIDQRVRDLYIDEEISCGNFILSGGELPVLTICDTIIRLIPGALGNEKSYLNDSFSESYDGMMEHPLYTKPRVFKDKEVPEVLLSGDHKKISLWQKQRRES